MIYTLPPDLVPALGTALYAGTSVVLIVVTNIYYSVPGSTTAPWRCIRRSTSSKPHTHSEWCRSVAASIRRRAFDRCTAWPLTLTGAVSAGTLAVSVAALANPALMRVMTRNLARLRAGQWWRIITPVLVQPDGWGQLGFNLLGIAVVGAALEHLTSRAAWTFTYLLGGVGGIAAASAWHPADLGGGSSDAVAALLGALTVLRVADTHGHRDRHDRSGRRPWAGWPAQLYCVFFAGYLTALDLGGVWWSTIAGNATIIAFFIARRALSPTGLTWACLLFVVAAAMTMTAQHDGHGIGIIAGVGIASLVLLRRRAIPA